MGLTKTEIGDIAEDLFVLAEDIIAAKKRKKPMTKAEIKKFSKRALSVAAKLAIDILD